MTKRQRETFVHMLLTKLGPAGALAVVVAMTAAKAGVFGPEEVTLSTVAEALGG